MRRLALLSAACMMLTACGAPQVEVFPSPDVSLAARPSQAAQPSSTRSPETVRVKPSTSPSAASEGSDPDPAPLVTEEPVVSVPTPTTPVEQPVAPAFRPIGGINDAQGDVEPWTPAWADVIGLVLEDDGDMLRVGIDLAAEVPETLRNNETARIAVDFFRGDNGESRYRLFVDGSREGWLAYFQRQDGFVDYSGTFSINGTRVILTLPASLIGNPVRGEWRASAGWHGPGGRQSSMDAAPDAEWSTFSR